MKIGLLTSGGEGTLAGAARLAEAGLPAVGVPKTIDNDLQATDYTFGFDTVVSIATHAMDRLRTTGESYHRCMVPRPWAATSGGSRCPRGCPPGPTRC